MSRRVTLIPGDGTGPELIEATRRVLAAARADVEWEIHEAGESVIAKKGTPLPDEVVEACRRNGVTLKGPITTRVGSGHPSVTVALRKALNLYACVRPCRAPPRVDLVVVRENTEDTYGGAERMVGTDAAECLRVITRKATERIARFAFRHARERKRRKVTIVHKATVLKRTDGLFLETARAVAKEFPEIECDDRTVDTMATQLVQKPGEYDVLLCPNVYGDILGDLAAGLIGGIGVTPSATFGEACAVFEAAHGSAPRYAGLNRMNPTALILSACLMLEHVGQGAVAERIRHAVEKVIADGRRVTYDLGGAAGTREMADAIAEAL